MFDKIKIENVKLNCDDLNRCCNLIMRIIDKKVQWDHIIVNFNVSDLQGDTTSDLEVVVYDLGGVEYNLDMFVTNQDLDDNLDFIALKKIFNEFNKDSSDEKWNYLKFQFDHVGNYHYEVFAEGTISAKDEEIENIDLISNIQNEVSSLETTNNDSDIELLEELPLLIPEIKQDLKMQNASLEFQSVKEKVERNLNNTISYFQLLELVRKKVNPYKINFDDKNFIFNGITYVEETCEPFCQCLLNFLLKDNSIREEALTNLRMIKVIQWESVSSLDIKENLFTDDVLSS